VSAVSAGAASVSPTHTGPPRLLIDTDPGVDDAIALMTALGYPGARVEAITVVAGNAGLEQTVRNARSISSQPGLIR
jgi:inosine-uridine nucleoside N-ribohydrolase